nr:MAG TPA: tail completion protein [Caudoviricetes sp.]
MTIIERIADELARISPNTTIYTENQPNGFDEPCFFIGRAGNTTLKPELFDYEVRKMPFQVVYFPPEENANEALDEMEALLMDNLTVLPDFAYLRNREFSVDTNEHTLTYDFDLVLRMYKPDLSLKQRSLDLNARTKGNNR